MAEMEEIKEEEGSAVEFALPLSVQKYPHRSLRAKNATVGVFDEELAKLSAAMFKLMYETDGVGLAAPQVGVNYRMMVYNEAGAPGEGKEVTLVNPKITKFAKQKDLFEEGCLSFPAIYAEVEVRRTRQSSQSRRSFHSKRAFRETRVSKRPRSPDRRIPNPAPRAPVFRRVARDRKPVSINNKYTLIPAERVPKSDEQPFSEAFVEQQAFISTRFPVPRFCAFSLGQKATQKATHRASPAPPPHALRRRRDPRACRSKRRTCPGRSSR